MSDFVISDFEDEDAAGCCFDSDDEVEERVAARESMDEDSDDEDSDDEGPRARARRRPDADADADEDEEEEVMVEDMDEDSDDEDVDVEGLRARDDDDDDDGGGGGGGGGGGDEVAKSCRTAELASGHPWAPLEPQAARASLAGKSVVRKYFSGFTSRNTGTRRNTPEHAGTRPEHDQRTRTGTRDRGARESRKPEHPRDLYRNIRAGTSAHPEIDTGNDVGVLSSCLAVDFPIRTASVTSRRTRQPWRRVRRGEWRRRWVAREASSSPSHGPARQGVTKPVRRRGPKLVSSGKSPHWQFSTHFLRCSSTSPQLVTHLGTFVYVCSPRRLRRRAGASVRCRSCSAATPASRSRRGRAPQPWAPSSAASPWWASSTRRRCP
jgi:hypothetical protein